MKAHGRNFDLRTQKRFCDTSPHIENKEEFTSKQWESAILQEKDTGSEGELSGLWRKMQEVLSFHFSIS